MYGLWAPFLYKKKKLKGGKTKEERTNLPRDGDRNNVSKGKVYGAIKGQIYTVNLKYDRAEQSHRL